MPRETGRRTEACFMSDSLEGEFTGGDVMGDDRGYCGSGCEQGGIVDTPDGKWYSIVFQDSGAVGRLPILIPVRFNEETGMPEFGFRGKAPLIFKTPAAKPGYAYEPLVGSDDFKDCDASDDQEYARKHASFGFKSRWQFNHEPDLTLVSRDEKAGTVTVTTDKLCKNVVQAKNVLTQRTTFPGSAAEITVDGSALKEGDYAGLVLLESAYAFAALTRRNGELWIVMKNRKAPDGMWGERHDTEAGDERISVKLAGETATLRAETDFAYMKDMANLFYVENGVKKPLGPTSKLCFKLDHFTGVRFGLFVYATKEIGGSASFTNFRYETKVDGAWEKC